MTHKSSGKQHPQTPKRLKDKILIVHVTSDEILLRSTDLKTKLNKQSAIKLQSAKVGQDESLAIQRHTKKRSEREHVVLLFVLM